MDFCITWMDPWRRYDFRLWLRIKLSQRKLYFWRNLNSNKTRNLFIETFAFSIKTRCPTWTCVGVGCPWTLQLWFMILLHYIRELWEDFLVHYQRNLLSSSANLQNVEMSYIIHSRRLHSLNPEWRQHHQRARNEMNQRNWLLVQTLFFILAFSYSVFFKIFSQIKAIFFIIFFSFFGGQKRIFLLYRVVQTSCQIEG